MRISSNFAFLALIVLAHVSNAFHTTFTKSSTLLQYNPKSNSIPVSPTTLTNSNRNDLFSLNAASNNNQLQKLDRVFDTMKTAGFENYAMQMSPKRFLLIFFGMMLFKYIRSRKLKQSFMEKQPAWGHVITSKEEEKNLHAWTCKNCGSTMFIAKGREIRFFNPLVGIECQTCGAKGKDSFYDRREEIAAEDDTDFEYENPMDYISKEERKKLMKQMEAEKKKEEEALIVNVAATSEGEKNSSGGNGEKTSKGSSDDSDPLGMDL